MSDFMFSSVFGTADSLVSSVSASSFLLCSVVSIVLGLAIAGVYMFRHRYSKNFVVTLALLPLIVQMVITLVNGNLGAGIAVMGVFNLVRFRSIPGSAKDIGSVFLAMAVRASRVPFKFIVRGLKAIVFLLLISISFNLFLTNGRVIFRIGFLKVTHEGLRLAVFMGLRLMYLVIGSSVMTLTTTPNQLTDGLEKSLGCLNRIHVPVHEISMMMSIALRLSQS